MNRKTILLALLVAACLPCAAALAAQPERFKADAFDVSVDVTGSYSGDSTGGPPDDYVERHQRVQFNYGASWRNVWFPVKDVPPHHGTEWFGRGQKVDASFSNTGFNVIGAQRADVNCAGRMTTDLSTPIMFWDNHHRRGFKLELHPILNLLYTDDCAEPFMVNGGDTELNLRLTHSDLRHRTVTRVLHPSRAQRPPDFFYCLTLGMTPHTCAQSLHYAATVTLKRACSASGGGRLEFVQGAKDVYTYLGRCGRRH